jgi:hypothetical protein
MRCALLVGLVLAMPSLVSAQNIKRPPLPAGRDTNDASHYLWLAEAELERNPGKAEQAFIWATRLAPNSVEAWYGRWVAHLLSHPDRHDRWLRGDRRAMQSKEMIALDSIRLVVHGMSPFHFGRYEGLLFTTFITRTLREALGPRYEEARAEIEYHVENYLRSQGPAMNGWMAYTRREFSAALAHYTSALKQSRDRASIQWLRAQLFHFLGQGDSAIAALRAAAAERAKENKDRLTHIYESQAGYEFGIGWLYEQHRDLAQAREAYARALLSELSFYPAQLRLGELALLAGDTTTALTAFRTAVDIRPNDGWIRYVHGYALLHAGQLDDAVRDLTRATELEPYFAAPYYYLARAAELRERNAEASGLYRQFLERASKRDQNRPAAEARLRQLAAS